MIRSKGNPARMNNILSGLPAILELAVLEREGDGQCHLVGIAPDWLLSFFAGAQSGDALALGEQFPFVENFLIDCENFWLQGKPGKITSGAWTETDASGHEWALEAYGVASDARHLLLIQNLGAAHEGQLNILQTARNNLLASEALEAEVRRRAQAESELKVASERLSLAMSAANLVLWDFDIARGVMYLSRVWAEVTGEEGREAISIRAEDLEAQVHPEDVAPMREQIKATMKGMQAAYQIDQRIRRKNGQWKWIHSHGMVTERDASGKAVRATGINVDIDERKRAEEALRAAMQDLAQAEQRMRAMTDGVPGAVYQFQWVEGKRPRVLFISAGVAELIGVDRTRIESEPDLVFKAALDEDRAAFVASLNEATARKATHWSHEFRVRRGDGTIRWTRSEASRQGRGAEAVWNGYWVDVTAQREIEAKLSEAKVAADQANRAKSVFLATMSHEIRTPMNAILGLVELLGLTKLDAEQGKMLGVVRDAADSLLQIINDILDVSRIEAGQMAIHAQPASLAAVIEAVVATLADSADRKGLSLNRQIDPAIAPALLFDTLRLKQILFNLVGNAIKFTQQGQVAVHVALVGDKGASQLIRIEVEDTGIGILPQDQKRLFQPFVQAEADTTRRFGGSGLGLVICCRLVHMMGGTLTLSSELGRGTTMTLLLELRVAREVLAETRPVQAGRGSALTAAGSAFPQAQRGTARVLVVEDMEMNRAVIRRQLALLGCEVDFANNGEQALRLWRQGHYALVLCDCQMPVMDGYTFARQVRAAEAGEPVRIRVPIVACTANAMREDAQACFAAGMDEVLAKPVSLDALRRVLGHWVDSRYGVLSAVDATAPLLPDTAGTRHGAGGNPLESPVDRAWLRQITDGDAGLENELFALMRAKHAGDCAMLQAAIDGGDLVSVARTAHKVKGTVQAIAARDLIALCERIEHAAARGEREATVKAKPDLERESSRLIAYLERLKLDAAEPARSADLDPRTAQSETVLADLGVLVVDDDHFQRMFVARLLTRMGVAEVHEAQSGSQALDLLKRGDARVDVIVCDLNMPEMDGMVMLRMIADAGYAPSIIISSAADQNIMRSVEIIAQAQGFTVLGLVPKPPTLEALRALLVRHRSREERRQPMSARSLDAAEVGRGLASGQFEAFFQPKVDLHTLRVCGAEVLARWRHPTLGLLPPGAFLNQILDAGEMPRMTWIMIEAALTWCKTWREAGMDVAVSVNLSLAAMGDPDFPVRVLELVRDHGLAAECLIFEVTETSAMTDVAGCLETLTRLKMQGFGLSLDDFGTGFSSLQQLSRIPFSELKLDQSFVTGAAYQPHLRAVVESTVGMAKKLQLSVAGEGVETIEDWRFLRTLMVDTAQGNLVCKAMPGGEFQAWAASWSPPV